MSSNEKETKALWRDAIKMAMTFARIEDQAMSFSDDLQITPREIHTIQLIGSSKRTNITDVSRFFKVTKSAASQLISKLVKKGFITKEKASDNNKEHILALTNMGKRAFQTHNEFHKKHMNDFAKRLKGRKRKGLEDAREVINLISEVMKDRTTQMTKE